MKEKSDILVSLESAMERIVSGNATIAVDRKLSVSAVECEAGMSSSNIYYYTKEVKVIKDAIKQYRLNQGSTLPKTAKEKADEERKIKEKYRDQVSELRLQVSKMAAEHHQMTDALMIALKENKSLKNENKSLKDELAKKRREGVVLIKDCPPPEPGTQTPLHT